jgi:hypothetical protein
MTRSVDTAHVWLPNRSPNRRSFRGGLRSRRAIEITGRRGGGEAGRSARTRTHFSIRRTESKNISLEGEKSGLGPSGGGRKREPSILTSRISPSPRLAVNLGGSRHELISTKAARGATSGTGTGAGTFMGAPAGQRHALGIRVASRSLAPPPTNPWPLTPDPRPPTPHPRFRQLLLTHDCHAARVSQSFRHARAQKGEA